MGKLTIDGQEYRRVPGTWSRWRAMGTTSPDDALDTGVSIASPLTKDDAQAFGDEILRLRNALTDVAGAGVVGCEGCAEMTRIAEEAIDGCTKK